MRIVSFDEYLDLSRPKVDWIIDGLIPRPGFVMLMGPPKVGKSFLSLDLALKIARGETFLGRPCVQSRVLYFQMDTSERVWRDRGLMLRQAGVNTTASDLGMVHPADEMRPLNMLLPHAQSYVRQALKDYDPALVILDTLREVHTEDENDSTCMKRVFDALETLFRGRSVVIVHHTNKINPEYGTPDPVRAARGSSYITGKMDAYWLLYDGKLIIESRFDEKQTHKVIQSQSGMLEFPATQTLDEMKARILETCANNPQDTHGQIVRKVAEKHGYSRSTLYRVLSSIACVHNVETTSTVGSAGVDGSDHTLHTYAAPTTNTIIPTPVQPGSFTQPTDMSTVEDC